MSTTLTGKNDANLDALALSLPSPFDQRFRSVADSWTHDGKVARLWSRDASLWTSSDESKWMGWLDIVTQQRANLATLKTFQSEVKNAAWKYAVVLGMGGSSLCPEVTALTFGHQPGFPQLLILDSTDPAQVAALDHRLDLKRTLFIVASKSGSTLEPNIFKQYFFERTRNSVGDQVGKHFVAVTDPGSKMEQVARSDNFAHIFYGVPSIGGRYSALSDFGLVPAAAAGLDLDRLLDRAEAMATACTDPNADNNPGVRLGLALGTLGVAAHDKITIVASPKIFDLGAWLEQLIAESTGKIGKGLIPVDREPLGAPAVYGKDRVFVSLHLRGDDDEHSAALGKLASAGNPVLRIELNDLYDVWAEYFRWEIATAVAGSVIGINPFDQPDVEASKIVTRSLTTEYEKNGALPLEQPFFEENDIKLFADDKNAAELKRLAPEHSLAGYLHAHLARLHAGDYAALLAYIQMNAAHEDEIQRLRMLIRDRKQVATCVGFGPRFLHSTGQAYKGGPNSGVFLQFTCDHAHDLPVPGQKYTFGVVEAAQARGDLEVLNQRGRRALRIHLPADVGGSLARITDVIQSALK